MHALEKEMATHSSVLAWRLPGTAEPGGLRSMGSHRVGNDWSDLAAAAAEKHRSPRLFRHTNDPPLKTHGALIHGGWYDSPGLNHPEDILTYTHTHARVWVQTHTHTLPCRTQTCTPTSGSCAMLGEAVHFAEIPGRYARKREKTKREGKEDQKGWKINALFP